MIFIPVIVSGAQYTQPKGLKNPLDPLNLMAKTSKLAIDQCGSENIRNYIDTIFMVNIKSWSYRDAPEELSKLLNIRPKHKVYLSDGGDTPQLLVNRAIDKIASGKSSAILITGAEAAHSLYQAKKGKIKLNWAKKENPSYMEGKIWHGTNNFENDYELIVPSYTYAIFETAIRAEKGRSIEEHKRYMGELFQHFSEIASKNPYAWSSKKYSTKDIVNASNKNRKICHPYTKRMCSNLFVDQAASIIITNESIAKKIRIRKEKWVYHLGGGDFQNIFNITQRPSLTSSPACREGVKQVLKQAKLKLDDINKFDIYSCFPSIVEIIAKELGFGEDEPRDLSVTGGLPYFGGPWSNYSLHAVVTTLELIRKDPKLKIMVIANGGYNTKQSFGIYGANPPSEPRNKINKRKIKKKILKKALQPPVKKANGMLTIEGYTFIFNREGIPIKGITIGTLSSGIRTLAYIYGPREKLGYLLNKELVGETFLVQFDENSKRNVIKLN